MYHGGNLKGPTVTVSYKGCGRGSSKPLPPPSHSVLGYESCLLSSNLWITSRLPEILFLLK